MEIIAEISGNHGGSILCALELIKQAKWAGADAVKFQCFDPERLAEKRSKNPDVLKLADGKDLLSLYLQTHTPQDWFPRLIDYANGQGIAWFSSVFDPLDVEFLEGMGCPRYKISAFEMLDWELIRSVKATGKPIIISVRPSDNVTILHATNYDGSISTLGLSDHGYFEPFEDLPMIEWHLKLPSVHTPDSDFSLTAPQMRALIEKVRVAA